MHSIDHSQPTVAGQITYAGQHPVELLADKARLQFENMIHSQSKTLDAAITTYRSRYGRIPPPGFDRWFQMATKNNYVFIDEFDTIMETLEIFWSVSPSVLRQRIDEAGETAPMMLRFSIKDKEIQDRASHKGIYEANIIDRWLEKPGWMDILPDMTFIVNRYDEPRGIRTFHNI
jgi:hypothetical protein